MHLCKSNVWGDDRKASQPPFQEHVFTISRWSFLHSVNALLFTLHSPFYFTAQFINPGKTYAETNPTSLKYYQAGQIYDRVKLVPNDANAVSTALMYVDSGERVFVWNLVGDQSITNLCDYEIISGPSFPTALMGFFANNGTPAWFNPDAALMQSIGYTFQHRMNKFYAIILENF